MKKLLAFTLILCFAFGLTACSSKADTRGGPTQTTSSPNASRIKTVNEYVEALKSDITISQVNRKAAEMVGALDGAGFFVEEQSFELFLFDDQKALNEAKSGSFVLRMQGFAPMTMLSSVNGNFMLLYDENNTDVINAFLNVKV